MIRLIVATRNAHKAAEIGAVLGSAVRVESLAGVTGVPGVVEDAPTLEGNAVKKALSWGRWLSESQRSIGGTEAERRYLLADDSGLEVDALGGAPGVHSARFAATGATGNASDEANNAKLMALLRDVPESRRGARFRCVLALLALPSAPNLGADACLLFEGICHGRIAASRSGSRGFGYDPLFIPSGCGQSFAELGEEVKHRLSHRARALEGLRRHLAI